MAWYRNLSFLSIHCVCNSPSPGPSAEKVLSFSATLRRWGRRQRSKYPSSRRLVVALNHTFNIYTLFAPGFAKAAFGFPGSKEDNLNDLEMRLP